jgi:hypothetical protein
MILLLPADRSASENAIRAMKAWLEDNEESPARVAVIFLPSKFGGREQAAAALAGSFTDARVTCFWDETQGLAMECSQIWLRSMAAGVVAHMERGDPRRSSFEDQRGNPRLHPLVEFAVFCPPRTSSIDAFSNVTWRLPPSAVDDGSLHPTDASACGEFLSSPWGGDLQILSSSWEAELERGMRTLHWNLSVEHSRE